MSFAAIIVEVEVVADMIALYRFLYHTISSRVFSPALIPALLLQIRILVFPNNSLGPSPPPKPSPEEALQIRSQAATDILSLIPKPIARIFFAVEGDRPGNEEDSMRMEIEERMLGWTDDAEMNKYLVYTILEHVILKLVPEMKDKTPSELLAERGVDLLEFEEINEEEERKESEHVVLGMKIVNGVNA